MKPHKHPKVLVDFLINRARSFIYSTALPPALTVAAHESLKILQTEPARRDRLWKRIRQLEAELDRDLGNWKGRAQSPIFPLILGEEEVVLSLSHYLLEKGFWVTAIRPPTIPQGTSRLRITVMANHSEGDIQALVKGIVSGIK